VPGHVTRCGLLSYSPFMSQYPECSVSLSNVIMFLNCKIQDMFELCLTVAISFSMKHNLMHVTYTFKSTIF
jgi:hypothetical protein